VSLPQTSPSVGLTHLDRADLTVLDLGLSYLLDALREDPDVLPAPEERVALRDLHRQVLDLKLSGCSGGPGPHRMRKTELTKLEFDALMVGGFASRHEDERCRCATWRDTP
jgi:hypothetical protein